MITIVEPKEAIAKLWGKQKVRENDTYRLMRYVLRVDHDGKVLLHNVVTGQLVVLSEEEGAVLDQLPSAYTPTMEQLVSEHYLVPEDFDEPRQVINLRNILWKLHEAQSSKDIVYYTILPTTGCNARCEYCFQKGVKTATMTEQTADDVVEFISSNCGGKDITIRWFGGEPTLAIQRIDQICAGLRQKQIHFCSLLTTNGYLLDEPLVEKAKALWNLKMVTVSVDGTEKIYNRVKGFVGIHDNPYEQVMHNIGILLDHEIYVGLRMNFDQNNYRDFVNLLNEAEWRFEDKSFLEVYAHPIVRDFSEMDKDSIDREEQWYNEMIPLLEDQACKKGFHERKGGLPSLFYRMCEAANDGAVTILPQGSLVSCGEQLGNDQIKGNLKQGVTNESLVRSWKRFDDHDRCVNCVLFPDCPSMANCRGNGRCYHKTEKIRMYSEEINQQCSGFTCND